MQSRDPNDYPSHRPTDYPTYASYLIAAGLLAAAIFLHLIPALFSGMLVFSLIERLAPLAARHFSKTTSRMVATALIGSLMVAAVSLGALLLYGYLKSNGSSGLVMLWDKLATVVEGANAILPAWIVARLPDSADQFQSLASTWLHEHSAELQGVGKEASVALVHVLIGGIIGAMVAVSASREERDGRPLAVALRQRVVAFRLAFERVFVGQGKISLINTSCTAVYLLLVLPALGFHLPFIKTMLAITLVVGLLPVVGNLISNTVIVLVSASVSFNAALASLAFLVVLHKAEYFLGAKILGHQIQAKAWEMLLAMLLMEAAFGLPGMAAAPVFYAYLKGELTEHGLV